MHVQWTHYMYIVFLLVFSYRNRVGQNNIYWCENNWISVMTIDQVVFVHYKITLWKMFLDKWVTKYQYYQLTQSKYIITRKQKVSYHLFATEQCIRSTGAKYPITCLSRILFSTVRKDSITNPVGGICPRITFEFIDHQFVRTSQHVFWTHLAFIELRCYCYACRIADVIVIHVVSLVHV